MQTANITSKKYPHCMGEDEKKINQDNYFVFRNFVNNVNYIFMAVCDGHGTVGQEISNFSAISKVSSVCIKRELAFKLKYKSPTGIACQGLFDSVLYFFCICDII